jgi:type I restriction enzyme M protein
MPRGRKPKSSQTTNGSVKLSPAPAATNGKLTLQNLESHLWGAADILRGKIDSSDYKHYIFGLLFFKRLSDVWREEYEKRLVRYGGPKQ